MANTLTLKTLTEKTGAPFYTIKYLHTCRRLPVIKESKGQGYPVQFHPDSIQIVKQHLSKNQ